METLCLCVVYAAAMYPNHNGKLVIGGLCGSPDVQIQAVFFVLGGHHPLGNAMYVGRQVFHFHHMLDGCGGVLGSSADTAPAAMVLGMAEAEFTHGGSRVGNSLEDLQVIFRIALQPAFFYQYLCVFKITHCYTSSFSSQRMPSLLLGIQKLQSWTPGPSL